MGVYIKEMEMPETCEKCRMNVAMFLFSGGPIGHCMLLKGRADKRKCPLVPVQTPHGRLIDADDVNNHILGYVHLRDCPTIIEAEGK